MPSIRLLRGEWSYDESRALGESGGFGAVFEGVGPDGAHVAIKRLNPTPLRVASREMHVADELQSRDLVHVLPFLDSGQDANSERYFVVMPIAERSLHDEIESRGTVPQDKAVRVLINLVNGLLEVDDLIHRDLKPRNVLYHEGSWKIADFGLARFIEESTSANTVMDGMTPAYASPEQWNLESATHATDVYALGCIAYRLLTGHPPFQGPTKADYKRQHLRELPPELQNATQRLRSLISMMLRKSPDARPDLSRVMNLLEQLADVKGTVESDATQALARAGAIDAERLASEETITRETEETANTRMRATKEGLGILKEIQVALFQRIKSTAPTANTKDYDSFRRDIELGLGRLTIGSSRELQAIPIDAFSRSQCDVVCGAYVKLVQQTKTQVCWASSLWYMRRPGLQVYRWHEVSYMSLGVARQVEYQPFELNNLEDADLAMSNVVHVYQTAFGPRTCDDEDMEGFIERWIDRFAAASEGRLQAPASLPLD